MKNRKFELEISLHGVTSKKIVIEVNREEEVQPIAVEYFSRINVLNQYPVGNNSSQIANKDYYIFECYLVDANIPYDRLYCAMKK